jgi:hypothetical protein
MSVVLFTHELDVDILAFKALPSVAQKYINDILDFKWAKINGWSWCDINQDFQPDNLNCVKLCFTGSPARDIGITWVYNIATNTYQEYLTQYHKPVSIIKMRKNVSSFDDFLLNLNPVVFAEIDC